MTIMNNILSKTGLGALAVGAAMLAGTVTASAATLTGMFTVEAVNVTNVNSAQSEATATNFAAALALGSAQSDTFTYTGALNFGTSDGTDATTITDWLATGGGMVSGLENIGGLQLSKPDIGNGTATTTFFKFAMEIISPVTEFVVRHDDGMTIYDDQTEIGGFQDPTSVRETSVFGFDGGDFELYYAATNGDPSILEVSAVPLPAGGLLLLTALGGMAVVRRRRKAA